jgi:hypothetical protein
VRSEKIFKAPDLSTDLGGGRFIIALFPVDDFIPHNCSPGIMT